MSLIKSLVTGSGGSYNVLGMPVSFTTDTPSGYFTKLEGVSFISQLADKCIRNPIFRLSTLSYTHLFVHEMSHALAFKLVSNQNSEIAIYTSEGKGKFFPTGNTGISSWKASLVSAAGPMGDVAFSVVLLVASTALKSYISWPVALALGGGAFFWISGELLYAFVSASKSDTGDFGNIARQGHMHLLIASAALVAQVSLGVFVAVQLL